MSKILLGYLASFAFIATVILIGEIIHKKFNTDKEMTRKVEHMFTGFGWAICYAFFGDSYHMVVINAVTLVLLVVLTFTGAMKSVERKDTKRSYGLLYFGVSTMINICIAVFCDVALMPLDAIAYFTLTLADGAAPIVAKLAGKRNRVMFAPKTLVGFLTVFAVTAMVATVCSLIFGLGLSPLFILSLACLAAHAELYGMKGLDNLTLPLAVFGYLVLNHYGFVTSATQIAIILLLPITILATRTKALTYYGGVVSFVCFVVNSIIAPPMVVTVMMSLFVVEAILSKIATKKKEGKKSHPRGAYQIFANISVSFACALLYAWTMNKVFLLGAVVSLAEEFADSVASAVGRFSRTKPVDILRFKQVDYGISGGVSLIGFAGAVAAAFAGVAIVFFFEGMSLAVYLVASGLAFFGTIIDSLLGSSIQALYKCPVCGKTTELRTHCSARTERVKGLIFVDNATVNLLSAVLTATLAVLVLSFI